MKKFLTALALLLVGTFAEAQGGYEPPQVGYAKPAGNNTWTGTQTFIDNKFILQDDLTAGKKAVFQLAGFSTAATRTFNFPSIATTRVTDQLLVSGNAITLTPTNPSYTNVQYNIGGGGTAAFFNIDTVGTGLRGNLTVNASGLTSSWGKAVAGLFPLSSGGINGGYRNLDPNYYSYWNGLTNETLAPPALNNSTAFRTTSASYLVRQPAFDIYRAHLLGGAQDSYEGTTPGGKQWGKLYYDPDSCLGGGTTADTLTFTVVDTVPSITEGTLVVVGRVTNDPVLSMRDPWNVAVEFIDISAGAGTYTTTTSFCDPLILETIHMNGLGGGGDETLAIAWTNGVVPTLLMTFSSNPVPDPVNSSFIGVQDPGFMGSWGANLVQTVANDGDVLIGADLAETLVHLKCWYEDDGVTCNEGAGQDFMNGGGDLTPTHGAMVVGADNLQMTWTAPGYYDPQQYGYWVFWDGSQYVDSGAAVFSWDNGFGGSVTTAALNIENVDDPNSQMITPLSDQMRLQCWDPVGCNVMLDPYDTSSYGMTVTASQAPVNTQTALGIALFPLNFAAGTQTNYTTTGDTNPWQVIAGNSYHTFRRNSDFMVNLNENQIPRETITFQKIAPVQSYGLASWQEIGRTGGQNPTGTTTSGQLPDVVRTAIRAAGPLSAYYTLNGQLINGGYNIGDWDTPVYSAQNFNLRVNTVDPGGGSTVTDYKIQICGITTTSFNNGECETLDGAVPGETLTSTKEWVRVFYLKSNSFVGGITDETIDMEYTPVAPVAWAPWMAATPLVDSGPSDFVTAPISPRTNFLSVQCLDLAGCDVELAPPKEFNGERQYGSQAIWYVGRELTVVAADGTNPLTFTDSGNMDIEAAGPVVLGVGDVIKFIYVYSMAPNETGYVGNAKSWVQTGRSDN